MLSDVKRRMNAKSGRFLAVIFLAVCALYLFTFRAGQDWGGDFALYIAQAMSLCDGTIDEIGQDLHL